MYVTVVDNGHWLHFDYVMSDCKELAHLEDFCEWKDASSGDFESGFDTALDRRFDVCRGSATDIMDNLHSSSACARGIPITCL